MKNCTSRKSEQINRILPVKCSTMDKNTAQINTNNTKKQQQQFYADNA